MTFVPVPAWYARWKSLRDLEDQRIWRKLDMFGYPEDFERFDGMKKD